MIPLNPFSGYNGVSKSGRFMCISAGALQQAIELYLRLAYPTGVPAEIQTRVVAVRALPAESPVPAELLEKGVANAAASAALRLGQPLYPHMKLVVDPCPRAAEGASVAGKCRGFDFLLRADAHDQHLHAAAGSPDAAWLASIRQSNKELGEKIEAAWSAAGLPTFKDYLRAQLAARKAAANAP
jgi:hypothetical protein